MPQAAERLAALPGMRPYPHRRVSGYAVGLEGTVVAAKTRGRTAERSKPSRRISTAALLAGQDL
jgi:hypothetical protein